MPPARSEDQGREASKHFLTRKSAICKCVYVRNNVAPVVVAHTLEVSHNHFSTYITQIKQRTRYLSVGCPDAHPKPVLSMMSLANGAD